jgi:hypothetical protein
MTIFEGLMVVVLLYAGLIVLVMPSAYWFYKIAVDKNNVVTIPAKYWIFPSVIWGITILWLSGALNGY